MEGAIVKAIVCSVQNGPYELKDVRIGAMSDDEITVRMVATGICHTDFACTNVTITEGARFARELQKLANTLHLGLNTHSITIDRRTRRCWCCSENWLKGRTHNCRRSCFAILQLLWALCPLSEGNSCVLFIHV